MTSSEPQYVYKLFAETGGFKGPWDGQGGITKRFLKRYQNRAGLGTLLHNGWDVFKMFTTPDADGKCPMHCAFEHSNVPDDSDEDEEEEGDDDDMIQKSPDVITGRVHMYVVSRSKATKEQLEAVKTDLRVIITEDEDLLPITPETPGVSSKYFCEAFRDEENNVTLQGWEYPCFCDACKNNLLVEPGGEREPCLCP